MFWTQVTRANPHAARLADRHYSRQTHGSPQFTPPGRVIVLLTEQQDAVWATSWPFARYVQRKFREAWSCSIFRNESEHLSSELIRQAVAVTRYIYGDPPADGMVTYVNTCMVKPKPHPGYCFRKAGFEPVGYSSDRGLLMLRLDPSNMPPAEAPFTRQTEIFEEITC